MSTKKIVYVESEFVESNKISMVEKIKRLADLKDPDVMDNRFLSHFASNLGYDVNINRSELGNLALANDSSADVNAEADAYMRFAIRNLPLWYKIKTTRNSLKMMLYSFGMVGDISSYYTNNYLPEKDGGRWIVPDYSMTNDSLVNVPDEFYPTPHFAVWVDLDVSENALSWEYAKRNQIVSAIESVKPVNTVFRKLGAYTKTNMELLASMQTRFHSRYIKIPCNGDSDYWV